MAKNKWFGTDGVRGVANEFPMTADFAFKLAVAVSKLVCQKHKKAAIAKDTRISGNMIEAAMTAGFVSQGIDVVRLGVVPTPAVTTFVGELGVDMAVMITASHNPYYDNGIKLIGADGDKFSDDLTAKIESEIEKGQVRFNKDTIGNVKDDSDVKKLYMQKAFAVAQKSDFSGLKVVVDCANGCFSDIFPVVLQKLGADVVAIGAEPNGYNINEACGSQHIEGLLEKVKECHADLGIAVDGDGDRIKMCDDKGQLIESEQLMAFLAQTLEQTGENKGRAFVSTKLSNTALERFVTNKLKLKYISTEVGERMVIKGLKENGGIIGGEESGHIVLLDYAKSGDALFTALNVIKGLKRLNKKASDVFPLFKDDFLFFENFKTDSRDKVKQVCANSELLSLVKELDKKIVGRGRVVIHPSGTEPKIRVWVCGDNQKMVADFGNQLWKKVKQVAER